MYVQCIEPMFEHMYVERGVLYNVLVYVNEYSEVTD